MLVPSSQDKQDIRDYVKSSQLLEALYEPINPAGSRRSVADTLPAAKPAPPVEVPAPTPRVASSAAPKRTAGATSLAKSAARKPGRPRKVAAPKPAPVIEALGGMEGSRAKTRGRPRRAVAEAGEAVAAAVVEQRNGEGVRKRRGRARSEDAGASATEGQVGGGVRPVSRSRGRPGKDKLAVVPVAAEGAEGGREGGKSRPKSRGRAAKETGEGAASRAVGEPGEAKERSRSKAKGNEAAAPVKAARGGRKKSARAAELREAEQSTRGGGVTADGGKRTGSTKKGKAAAGVTSVAGSKVEEPAIMGKSPGAPWLQQPREGRQVNPICGFLFLAQYDLKHVQPEEHVWDFLLLLIPQCRPHSLLD